MYSDSQEDDIGLYPTLRVGFICKCGLSEPLKRVSEPLKRVSDPISQFIRPFLTVQLVFYIDPNFLDCITLYVEKQYG